MNQPSLTTTIYELSQAIKDARSRTKSYYEHNAPYVDTDFRFNEELSTSLQAFTYNLPGYLCIDQAISSVFQPIEFNQNLVIFDNNIEIKISYKYYPEVNVPIDNSILMIMECIFTLDQSGRLEVNIANLPDQPEDGSYMVLNQQQDGIESFNGSFDEDFNTLNSPQTLKPAGIGSHIGYSQKITFYIVKNSNSDFLSKASNVNTLVGFGADGMLLSRAAREGYRRAVVATSNIAQCGKL